MESKNVKVIDEHGIDREANVICKIDLDGSDYVIYSIERDNDNDNLFVSKLVKNNDGTSNMLNIEDTMEKSKLTDIVKELIKYSIDSTDSNTNGVVTLANGKNVNISSVLFNKEQNINVGKTYISTVKKAVTKVSLDFYKIDNAKDNVVSPEENVSVEVAEMPEIEQPVIPEVLSVPSVEDVMNSFVSPSAVEAQPEAVETSEVASIPVVETEVSEVNTVIPEVAPVVPEVKPTEPVAVENVVEKPSTPVISPVVEEPKVGENSSVTLGPVTPVSPVAPMPTPDVAPIVEVSKNEDTPFVQTSSPVMPVTPVSDDTKLVFDASKETNLNVALGEVSNEGNISVNDVKPIREFGQDDEVVPIVPDTQVKQDSQASSPVSSSSGFANNKFFIVIAIVFFVAACVFLGYEVWQYFKITG